MRRRDFMALGAAAASGVTLAPGAVARGRVAPAAGADWSAFDASLAGRVERGYFDGMGLILGRGERILHQAYAGAATPATVLHVASVGKWVAAAVIAAVVDTGKLGWDDPVRRFLPEFTDAKGRATLRQLLSHTAGFPDYQPDGVPRDSYQRLDEAVRHIVELTPVAEPGALFLYGGLGMQVAGRMAELADDRDFEAIFRRRIALPLGMGQSGFAPVSQEPGFSPMLAGSLFTSSGDYARFLMMVARNGYYQGRRVLSRAAIAAMQSDQVRAATVRPLEYVERARSVRRQDVYGLGQWREEVDRRGVSTLLSAPGWAGAYAWLDRAYGVWGVVLAKANLAAARAAGYDSFLGSAIYAPMARRALDQARGRGRVQ